MYNILAALLTLLSSVRAIKVLLPASGNTWDLGQVNAYRIVWKHGSDDPSHLNVAIYDAAGKTVHFGERVRTEFGGYLVSDLAGITHGSQYRVVLVDASKSSHKLVARSGKFSIRQVDDSSSGVGQASAPAPAIPAQAQTSTPAAPLTSAAPSTSAAPPTPAAPSTIAAQSTSAATRRTSTSIRSSSHATTTKSPPQTSIGFPRYAIPGKQGLSTGAKAGIGVGVAVVVLAILGALFLFWRRRRRDRQQGETTRNAGMSEAGCHRKPELVGDAGYSFERDHEPGYIVKPELEDHSSTVDSSVSNDQRHVSQHDPGQRGISELPQQASTTRVHSDAELSGEAVHEAASNEKSITELSPTPSVNGRNSGQSRPLSHRKAVPVQEQRQSQNPLELPAANESTMTRDVDPLSESSPGDQLPHQAPSSPPVLPAAFVSKYSGSHSSQSRTGYPAAFSVPSETMPDANELEALRERERSIAASIAETEELQRLRRERLEVQQMIRRAEEQKRSSDAQNGR